MDEKKEGIIATADGWQVWLYGELMKTFKKHELATAYCYDSAIAEYQDRHAIERKSNEKFVECIETGEIFMSMKEAEKRLGLAVGCISKAANGVSETANGFHWRIV